MNTSIPIYFSASRGRLRNILGGTYDCQPVRLSDRIQLHRKRRPEVRMWSSNTGNDSKFASTCLHRGSRRAFSVYAQDLPRGGSFVSARDPRFFEANVNRERCTRFSWLGGERVLSSGTHGNGIRATSFCTPHSASPLRMSWVLISLRRKVNSYGRVISVELLRFVNGPKVTAEIFVLLRRRVARADASLLISWNFRGYISGGRAGEYKSNFTSSLNSFFLRIEVKNKSFKSGVSKKSKKSNS